jgi:hypothetical protein
MARPRGGGSEQAACGLDLISVDLGQYTSFLSQPSSKCVDLFNTYRFEYSAVLSRIAKLRAADGKKSRSVVRQADQHHCFRRAAIVRNSHHPIRASIAVER